MLELSDFFHLPELDERIRRIASSGPGLTVIAGPDGRSGPAQAGAGGVLPSGRSAIFQILIERILDQHPGQKCIVVCAEKDAMRVPRSLKGRVTISLVEPHFSYSERLAAAASFRPGLVAVDRLKPENILPALQAARNGLRVLAQLDTLCWGAEVVRQLIDLEAPPELLDASLRWVLSVQRLAKLCPHCKQPSSLDEAYTAELRQRFPGLDLEAGGPGKFFRAGSCERCRASGRSGDVAVFDVYTSAKPGDADEIGHDSLPMVEYVWKLARLGHLSPEDVLQLESNRFHQTFQLLLDREATLKSTAAAYERKLAELEAANRVMQQRTQSLISLQEMGQALITSADLKQLAERVCRRARELCGADRAILYYLQTPEQAEVLAVGGWERSLIHQKLDRAAVFVLNAVTEPVTYYAPPPGVPERQIKNLDPGLRAGLYVPLVTRDKQVGLMIVHSTQKVAFLPGEVALLKSFANQAALAIERAGLVDQLRAKIEQLEAAQTQLAKKERQDRELELAHEVQQSMLPRAFPEAPGYRFAAHNIPARQVGGDFYDVIHLDEDHFGVAIADVSDKGMPAALYMALTRSLLLAEARRERSPRQVLLSVDRLLQELGEDKLFVTLFYGVVDRGTHRLDYACAGHDRPALLRDTQVQFLDGRGGPLGILGPDDLQLAEETVQLEPGDRLALYTDGLVDLLAPDGQPFQRDRLEALLLACAGLPAQDFCTAVFTALLDYRGDAEQYDDMALLVMEVMQ